MEALKIKIKNIALYLFIGAMPILCWGAGYFAIISLPSFFLSLACLFCILWIKSYFLQANFKALLESSKEEWAILENGKITQSSQGFPGGTRELFLSFVDADFTSKVSSKLEALYKEHKPFQLRIKAREGGAIYELQGEFIQGKIILWLKDATKQVIEERRQLDICHKKDVLLHNMQTTLDKLPFLIWHRDEHQKIDYCNLSYSNAVQSTSSKVYENSIELIPTRFAKTLAKKAINLNESQSFECPAIANGERKQYRIVEFPDTKSGGSFGIAFDISELVESRLENKRIIDAQAEVLDHLSTAVAIYDSEGILQYYNQAYINLKSFDEEFLRSKPRLDQVLEDLRNRRQIPEYADFLAFKKKILQQLTEQREPYEELVHLPDERTIRMFTAPHPMGGLLFMLEDVTDYLSLERHNKSLLDSYQITLDNLFEGVVVIGSDNRLKIFNPSFLQMWNFKEREIEPDLHISQIIEKIKDLFDFDGDWEVLKAQIIENATDRVPKTGQIKRKDGKVVNFGYVPLPNGDHLLSYTDATDASKVQEALQDKNHALEAANELKSEFIANVTDELKSPLNAIIGFGEILSNKYFGDLNDKQNEYVKGVIDSSNRLLHLINDILDLASLEAGHMPLIPRKVSLTPLFEEVIDVMSKKAKLKKLKINLLIDKKIKEWILDERRLRQALYNLLTNAIKFTPAKGVITLEAKSVKNHLEISVSDTGVGISVEDQKRVMEKFERGKGDIHTGAGIGLSLVKNLVELHGGRLMLSSEVNQGTKVTLVFPKKALQNQAATGTPLVVEYSK